MIEREAFRRRAYLAPTRSRASTRSNSINSNIVAIDGATVRLVDASPWSGYSIVGDDPIVAYWCPFLQGTGLPGWVDIPRRNPTNRFVLTAAMQGCALVVTASPASAAHFRVSHNQHPETASTWGAMQNAGIAGVVSNLDYTHYGNPTGPDGGMTNAFNLLWRPPGKVWCYLSQSNRFVVHAKHTTIARDMAKPILNMPAGV